MLYFRTLHFAPIWEQSSGEDGIRTHGQLPDCRFSIGRFRPFGHPWRTPEALAKNG